MGNTTAGTQKSFWEKMTSREGQRKLIIVTFMFVPLLLLLVFTYIPFLEMVKFSFQTVKYGQPGTWVGLKNYIDVFQRSECFKSLFVSVYYMGGAMVQLALALFFATMFVFKIKGAGFFKLFMTICT
ncbi:MAG: hypothetical protein K1W28_02060 [Lachnospiraceae bacterium]